MPKCHARHPGEEGMSGWGGTSADYLRGYEAGYQEGLKHGGDDGLDIAIPLSWDAGIEAAAEWLESQEGHGSHNRFMYAAAIRKLKKP